MQKFKEKANAAAANWVRKLGMAEMYGWPPGCIGAGFQPQRPARLEPEKAQAPTGKKARP